MWWLIETSVAVSPTGVGVESGPTLGQTGGAGWLLGGVDSDKRCTILLLVEQINFSIR